MQSYGNFTLQHLWTKIWKVKYRKVFNSLKSAFWRQIRAPDGNLVNFDVLGTLYLSQNWRKYNFVKCMMFVLFLKSSTNLWYLAVHCCFYEHGEWNSSQIRLSCCADAIKQGKTTINCVKTSCLIQKTPKALIFGIVEFW